MKICLKNCKKLLLVYCILGIGKGLCIELEKNGAEVFAISRTQEDLNELKKQVFKCRIIEEIDRGYLFAQKNLAPLTGIAWFAEMRFHSLPLRKPNIKVYSHEKRSSPVCEYYGQG